MKNIRLRTVITEPDVLTPSLFDRRGNRTQRTQAFLYLRRRLWNALALVAGDTLSLMVALLLAGALRWWWGVGEPLV